MARERFEDAKVKVGFAGHEKEVTIKLHENDAPPWGLDAKLAVVGKATPRIDGPAKLTGRAKYSYDINLPGLLYAKILRCPHPKATLKDIDVSGALAVPGVKAAVKALNAGQTCRFAGHEVAAVAAETLDAAQDGLEKIRVEYEALEFNTDPVKSAGAPKFDERGNAVPPPRAEKQSELDAAFAMAAAVCEGTWRTQCQTHSSLETHGCTAWFKDDGKLTVWSSTQSTFSVRGALASALKIPQTDIEVITDFMGGGFGSKLGGILETRLACELSREAKAPVKLMLSRKEEHISVGNRPSSIQHIKAAVDKDGKITAWDHASWGNPGYGGRGGGTTSPQFYFAADTVRRRSGGDLQTDTDPARPFRAPGWPQGYFAFEGMLDELALAIGMDPLELRLRNDKSALRQHEFRLGAERIGWKEKRNQTPGKGGRMLRGVGCSSAAWGGSGGAGAQVTCRIHSDGSVELRNGAQDIGTGMKTVMAILGAEELSLPVARIKVFLGSTADPIGPGSGGSTTTPSLAPAVRHAAWLAKGELLARVAEHWKVEAATLSLAGGKVAFAGEPPRTMSFEDACKLIGQKPIEVTGTRFNNYRTEDHAAGVCGAMFAEVEVDSQLGLVHVVKMVGVQDCGRVIDELTAQSQVLGAMIQGISYALFEDKVFDHRTGRMVNPDFLNYKIAGPNDMPELEAHMITVATGHTNTGAMGLGEPPAVAAPGAIANAVRNAIGAPVRSIPITPDKVLAALAARRS